MTAFNLLTYAGPVRVSIARPPPASGPAGPIRYVGAGIAVELVRSWLEHECGHRGRVVGDRATPDELGRIMESERAQRFCPRRLGRRPKGRGRPPGSGTTAGRKRTGV